VDDHEAMRATELGEAAYMEAAFAGTSSAVKSAMGMHTTRIGGAAVTVMSNDPTGGFWSRVIGLGITEPVTDSIVDDILAFAHDTGAKSLVWQTAPDAAGPWQKLLSDRGLTPGAAWVKFAAPIEEVHADPATDLRIAPLDLSDGRRYGDLMVDVFEMPKDSALSEWCATQLGIPGFHMYGAWDGEQLAATACLYAANGIGALSGAATLPQYRGRGAQTALMARRVADAASLGCTWTTAETGTETEEDPNPSLHNMRRIGLRELYDRRNWIWRASTD
jgi:GNAT superfamily N-acetyltransferase